MERGIMESCGKVQRLWPIVSFLIHFVPALSCFHKRIAEIGDGLHGKESCKESHQKSSKKGRQKSASEENGQDREKGR